MDLLDRIDAATEGRCACGCQQPLTADGPSAYWAGPDCQRRWNEAQADRPDEVYVRDDAAPYPPGPMRWRPDLVTTANDGGLGRRIGFHRAGQLNYQSFDRDDGAVHLRLDDGHRFVGLDTSPQEWTDNSTDLWRRLERELTDPRHAVPELDAWLAREQTAWGYFAPSAAQVNEIRRAWDAIAAQATFAVEQIGAAVAAAFPRPVEPPPANVMERALAHRRSRNTGPAPAPLDLRRRRR